MNVQISQYSTVFQAVAAVVKLILDTRYSPTGNPPIIAAQAFEYSVDLFTGSPRPRLLDVQRAAAKIGITLEVV